MSVRTAEMRRLVRRARTMEPRAPLPERVLSHLRAHGPCTSRQLADGLGVGLPSLNYAIRQLGDRVSVSQTAPHHGRLFAVRP